MNINDVFPSKYLKASDLQGQSVVLTISGCELEELGQEQKMVLYFSGKSKGMVLNKTNANTIAGMFSPETDNWMGQKIEVFSMMVPFQGQQVPSLRVKAPAVQAEPPINTQPANESFDDDMDDEIPF